MSVLEENSGVKMDCKDSEKDESRSCSEGRQGGPDVESGMGKMAQGRTLSTSFRKASRSPLEPDPNQPSANSVHSSPKVKPNRPERFSLYDGDHKVLVMDDKILKAVPKKTYISPAIISVLASHGTAAPGKNGTPVLLAVFDGELSLCCDKDKGKAKPSFQLKEKKLASLNSLQETARQPFIFYKAQSGSRYTLESAAHPGWFICTSCISGEPVRVTNKVGKKEHTEFLFQKVCRTEMSP